jgi:hypothetical protein
MRSSQVRVRLAALSMMVLMTQFAAHGQNVPAAAASSPTSFPQLPLKRDSNSNLSAVESFGWTALLLAAAAAAAFALVRRKAWAGKDGRPSWLRPAAKPGTPNLVSRTMLTQHASLQVIEWNGEELLLGCTPHTVSLLVRRPSDSARDNGVAGGAIRDKA